MACEKLDQSRGMSSLQQYLLSTQELVQKVDSIFKPTLMKDGPELKLKLVGAMTLLNQANAGVSAPQAAVFA